MATETRGPAARSPKALLVRGDFLWTGSELLRDGGVLCVDGRIAEVGLWSTLREAHPDADVVGGSGRIVLPGLINAHHHGNGITSFARGVLDDNLEPWLAAMGGGPAVDPRLDTLLAALDTLAGGYTTMVLFQSTGDPATALDHAVARIEGCRDAGLRVAFGLDVVQRNFYVYGPDPEGFPPRRGLSTEDYISLLDELRSRYASDPLVEVFAAPSGPEWVTDETWAAAGEWSRRHRVPLHTHALESPLQAEFARREFDGGLTAHLDRLGALHEYTSLVHGVYLTEAEFDRMADRGAHLITNPGSNLRLRCGVSPVLLALERGVNVALGTDGCSLGDRDDALAELRLLFYLQRGVGIDTPALDWRQALAMNTGAAARVTPWGGAPTPDADYSSAAEAASAGSSPGTPAGSSPGTPAGSSSGSPAGLRTKSVPGIGAIAPGFLADLTVYDLKAAAGPWYNPELHPVHLLLHRGGRQHLDTVIVGGRIVWDAAGGSRLVDEEETARRIREQIEAQPRSDAGRDAAGASLPEVVTDYYRNWLRQE